MTAIALSHLYKSYRVYRNSWERLWEVISHRAMHKERQVLAPLSLEIGHGEVVGVIGVNGAGKSTLLKLIAGTLHPTGGSAVCQGQVCALLELGAGFHPEMTGRENIFLGGAVAGKSKADTRRLFESIVAFAGLEEVIDQPVKTYSSGMIMRLAFSVATAVDPDILILDETLSVGDGVFAHKSFERIMGFKNEGKTILFCSHSMYQVNAICSRVLWLDHGRLMMDGEPAGVVAAYSDFMNALEGGSREEAKAALPPPGNSPFSINRVTLSADGTEGSPLCLDSGKTSLEIRVEFRSDPAKAAPSLGVTLTGSHGKPVTSASSLYDGISLARDPSGRGRVTLTFPALALLRGKYWVNVFLLCDQGLHVHDKALHAGELLITQESPELGVVTLPRQWGSAAGLQTV